MSFGVSEERKTIKYWVKSDLKGGCDSGKEDWTLREMELSTVVLGDVTDGRIERLSEKGAPPLQSLRERGENGGSESQKNNLNDVEKCEKSGASVPDPTTSQSGVEARASPPRSPGTAI